MSSSKLTNLLASRKFWASVIGLVSVLLVNFLGEEPLPVEDLVNAVMIVVAVFVGSTALEDGLSRAGSQASLYIAGQD